MIKPKRETGTIYLIIEDNGTVKNGVDKVIKEGTNTKMIINNPTKGL